MKKYNNIVKVSCLSVSLYINIYHLQDFGDSVSLLKMRMVVP